MKITVLGSGTSHGIPVVGCRCPVCTSDDPRDKRMRSAVYIEGRAGETALIDAGPEFRLQAVRAGITHLDGIFLTHAHADHLHGLDDVRPLSKEKPIAIYGNQQTILEMEERFSYIWRETQQGGGKPRLSPRVIEGPVRIGGLTFTPVPVKHGALDILGWEVEEEPFLEDSPGPPRSDGPPEAAGESFLYLTDTSAIPPSTLAWLKGMPNAAGPDKKSPQLRVVIIGGLRVRPHETHFSFGQALDATLDLGATEVYLTHICHDHSHEAIEEFCKNFRESRALEQITIHPAQDGLVIIL